jgi:hypothetical protein
MGLFYFLNEYLKFIIGGLVAIIVISIIPSVISKLTKGRSSFLILQEFNFNENKDVFLEIKARPSGFWSWLLSLFDKAQLVVFSCSKRLLKCEVSTRTFPNLSKINYYIPMIKISCVSSIIINKIRMLWLILGIIFIIAGIASPSYVVETPYKIALVIVGITSFLCSFIRKRIMYFGIYLYDNTPFITITLEKGIINSIDKETFEAAVNTLNRIVLANAISK